MFSETSVGDREPGPAVPGPFRLVQQRHGAPRAVPPGRASPQPWRAGPAGGGGQQGRRESRPSSRRRRAPGARRRPVRSPAPVTLCISARRRRPPEPEAALSQPEGDVADVSELGQAQAGTLAAEPRLLGAAHGRVRHAGERCRAPPPRHGIGRRQAPLGCRRRRESPPKRRDLPIPVSDQTAGDRQDVLAPPRSEWRCRGNRRPAGRRFATAGRCSSRRTQGGRMDHGCGGLVLAGSAPTSAANLRDLLRSPVRGSVPPALGPVGT